MSRPWSLHPWSLHHRLDMQGNELGHRRDAVYHVLHISTSWSGVPFTPFVLEPFIAEFTVERFSIEPQVIEFFHQFKILGSELINHAFLGGFVGSDTDGSCFHSWLAREGIFVVFIAFDIFAYIRWSCSMPRWL